jgi:hypothetical protein
MMIDTEGCGWILAIIAVIGAVLGLASSVLFDAPKYAVLIGAIGLPLGIGVVGGLFILIISAGNIR